MGKEQIFKECERTVFFKNRNLKERNRAPWNIPKSLIFYPILDGQNTFRDLANKYEKCTYTSRLKTNVFVYWFSNSGKFANYPVENEM
ncbi:hypothetical protein D7Z94_02655 [Ulvibacterium marinum]|uniref:Uncharacterized protein n=1 Tax=Ulvibacterium marinum TaxID=2419782 RepID=A0A3B0CF84_9FLAO|nr:hypothetical protein D7Z94_02655 [Ulvibacterium marinum]